MNEPFQLTTAPNGVTYLNCVHLDAPHGFSTRLGGASVGAFGSMNLGLSAGDEEAVVRANRAAWAEALGVPGPIVGLHQVHGADVHAIATPPDETLKGDALITDRGDLAIGVLTADCTPILLHDPVSGAVGAVHAGWRGTVAHIVAATVAAMKERYGADPARMTAAIGPTIGPCCFEVGPEVAEAFAASPAAVVDRGEGNKPHIDLFAANRDQLLAAGLPVGQVHVSGLCTRCNGELFFSWRRDDGKTGRMQAAIAARPRP